MKILRASKRRIKLSVVSRNRKYYWLLLAMPSCYRVVAVEQCGISIMQLPFDTGTHRIWRWAGAHAEGYRD